MWCRFTGNWRPNVRESILFFLGVSTLKGETTKHIRNFEHFSCSKPRHIPAKWRLKVPIKYTFVLFYILFFDTVLFIYSVGRDGSVGIATRYGLDAPVIEYRWGARFSASVQTGTGAQTILCTMDTGSFPGLKRPERGIDHPPHLAEMLRKE